MNNNVKHKYMWWAAKRAYTLHKMAGDPWFSSVTTGRRATVAVVGEYVYAAYSRPCRKENGQWSDYFSEWVVIARKISGQGSGDLLLETGDKAQSLYSALLAVGGSEVMLHEGEIVRGMKKPRPYVSVITGIQESACSVTWDDLKTVRRWGAPHRALAKKIIVRMRFTQSRADAKRKTLRLAELAARKAAGGGLYEAHRFLMEATRAVRWYGDDVYIFPKGVYVGGGSVWIDLHHGTIEAGVSPRYTTVRPSWSGPVTEMNFLGRKFVAPDHCDDETWDDLRSASIATVVSIGEGPATWALEGRRRRRL